MNHLQSGFEIKKPPADEVGGSTEEIKEKREFHHEVCYWNRVGLLSAGNMC